MEAIGRCAGGIGCAEVGGQVRRRLWRTSENPSLGPLPDRVVYGLHEFTEESDDSPVVARRTFDVRAFPLLADDIGDRVTRPRERH